METVRGACSKDKVGGMVFIREDITPSMLEWKAVDDDKNNIAIPLNKLVALQATKETVPKMILQISYKSDVENEPDKKMKLHFNNRPTMNNIKDALQTIVARSRTRVEGSPSTPMSDAGIGSPSTLSSTFPGAAAAGKTGGTGLSQSPSGGGSLQPGVSPSTPTPVPSSSSSSATGNFSLAQNALSDANLLKNFELQQKLLLEDRNLRNIFTKSVMSFKLSPTIFWSSRINQLRTFALTISQHRGPYNVLSTIKPVATSDNQVNVNVTRDTINEIFEIYPIIKRAFTDLVPKRFLEGEFWSRFFNSKLFRRLRGDKIGINSGRGDVVLDKYLYMDEKATPLSDVNKESQKEAGKEQGKEGKSKEGKGKEQSKESNKEETSADATTATTSQADGNSPKRRKVEAENPLLNDNITDDNITVNKTIDLFANEQDNSQKLGNRPDMTMRFDGDLLTIMGNSSGGGPNRFQGNGRENEMVILMRNMNKLSSKMMSMSSADTSSSSSSSSLPRTKGETTVDGLSAQEVNEYEEELNLHDLNVVEESHYIKLNINTSASRSPSVGPGEKDAGAEEQLDDKEAQNFIYQQFQQVTKGGDEKTEKDDIKTSNYFDLTDTFKGKTEDIEKTSFEVSALLRQNFKTYKLLNKDETYLKSSYEKVPVNLVPDSLYQEIITYNITIVEFLSHFWKLFLQGKNPQQLKKLFTSLKNCANLLREFKTRATAQLEAIEIVAKNEKLRDKILKDFNSCLEPVELSLQTALTKYTAAAAAAPSATSATSVSSVAPVAPVPATEGA